MSEVKLPVREVRELYMACSQLADKELPFRLSYAIARTRSHLKAEVEASEELRLKLAEEKDREKAEKAWREHLAEEIEVRIHRVSPAVFDGVSIEPMVLEALLPMLDET